MTAPGSLLDVDSSAAVALVANRGDLGEWVSTAVGGDALRRNELDGNRDRAAADLAHEQLRALRIELWPHSRLATRACELRGAVTCYDASYVALAELLDAPLVTPSTVGWGGLPARAARY